MLKLVLKDLRVSAVFFWLVAPVYACLALVSAQNLHAHFWLTVGLTLGLTLLVPAIQWYQGSDIFEWTLPVDRSLLVTGRFATSGLALAASLLAAAYPALVLGLVGTMAGRAWPAWLNLVTVVEFTLVATLVLSVVLPVLFRWGLGAATVTGACVLVASAGSAIVAGPGTVPLRGIYVTGASPFAPFLRLMIVQGGVGLAVGVAAVLVAGMVLGSFRLSIAWCRTREF